MSATHEEVKQAIQSWGVASEIQCKQLGGKTQLTYKGVTKVFPHWLAVQKVNQIGADIGIVEHEL